MKWVKMLRKKTLNAHSLFQYELEITNDGISWLYYVASLKWLRRTTWIFLQFNSKQLILKICHWCKLPRHKWINAEQGELWTGSIAGVTFLPDQLIDVFKTSSFYSNIFKIVVTKNLMLLKHKNHCIGSQLLCCNDVF